MASIYLLRLLSIFLVGLAIWAFFWAVDQDQFEDLEGPSRLALEGDQPLSEDAKPRPD